MNGVNVMVRRLRKTYATPNGQAREALAGIDLDIAQHEFLSVVGPSGSGKSTLLHMIGAMDQPDEGEIEVDGSSILGVSESERARYRRTIGFVFQRYHLIPALTALDNVMTPVLPYRTRFDKVKRARELLDAVGLGDREQSVPGELSGGEQQRVAVARALINHPHLLLADEPTGNLDSASGEGIIELLQSVRRDYGLTLVVATHDSLIAARTDRVVSLHDGKVVDDLEPRSTKPTRDLLEEISGLDPRA